VLLLDNFLLTLMLHKQRCCGLHGDSRWTSTSHEIAQALLTGDQALTDISQ